MKRSEAVEEIRKILAMNGKDNGYGELEEALLHHMESLGMVYYNNKLQIVKRKNGDLKIKPKGWEPENEEN
jgi:hypothetical protein